MEGDRFPDRLQRGLRLERAVVGALDVVGHGQPAAAELLPHDLAAHFEPLDAETDAIEPGEGLHDVGGEPGGPALRTDNRLGGRDGANAGKDPKTPRSKVRSIGASRYDCSRPTLKCGYRSVLPAASRFSDLSTSRMALRTSRLLRIAIAMALSQGQLLGPRGRQLRPGERRKQGERDAPDEPSRHGRHFSPTTDDPRVVAGIMSPMLTRHPLEPLDADEIRAASAILRAAGHLRDRVRVIGLTLHEPTRDDLRRLAAGQALDRVVFAVLLDTASGETEEVSSRSPRAVSPRPDGCATCSRRSCTASCARRSRRCGSIRAGRRRCAGAASATSASA